MKFLLIFLFLFTGCFFPRPNPLTEMYQEISSYTAGETNRDLASSHCWCCFYEICLFKLLDDLLLLATGNISDTGEKDVDGIVLLNGQMMQECSLCCR